MASSASETSGASSSGASASGGENGFTLRGGGLMPLTQAPLEKAEWRLSRQSFMRPTKVCAGEYCVSGTLSP